MMEICNDVIVVGGGAAGMMAAIAAADCGHSVTLIEHNEKLGKKLFITGKGRCNVTNNSDVEQLLKHVISNPKFLYSAFYAFDSQRMIDFLEMEGLALKTERGNRVFPVSDKSSDVIKTLQGALEKRGVQILLNTEVQSVITKNQTVVGVKLRGEDTIHCGKGVVLATGGLSYSSTGSTGDGHRIAKELGHNVTKCYPALVPLNTQEEWAMRLQGLSLRNITMTVKEGKKELFHEMGEMLFTHFGISGPLVLSASSLLGKKDYSKISIQLDLKPGMSVEELDARVLRDFAEKKNGIFKNALSKLLPTKLEPIVVELSGINPEKRVNEITKQERQGLVYLIKHLQMHPDSPRSYREAIVTGGGVNVKEVNPATMESKQIKGLFFAGELLDLDATTGGYNLQIAWATGYLAGISVLS